MPCPHCNDTGWMNVRYGPNNERMGVTRCVCRTRKKAEAEKERPGGFEKITGQLAVGGRQSGLAAVLNETDRKIARLIEERRGQNQAISIGEIAATVWPDATADSLPKLQRSIKATVEKLRMLARLPIAATKAPPYGYYIPVTAEECDECYRRLFGEGVKLILLSRLFRPDADVVAELRGQLKF